MARALGSDTLDADAAVTSVERREMKLNGMHKIDDAKGQYIVLVDYGSAGISVMGQYERLDQAVSDALKSSGGDVAIVQLVEVSEL